MTDWAEHYLTALAAMKEVDELLRFKKNTAACYAIQRAIDALEKVREIAEDDARRAA